MQKTLNLLIFGSLMALTCQSNAMDHNNTSLSDSKSVPARKNAHQEVVEGAKVKYAENITIIEMLVVHCLEKEFESKIKETTDEPLKERYAKAAAAFGNATLEDKVQILRISDILMSPREVARCKTPTSTNGIDILKNILKHYN
jgi:hypothetical protein